MSNKKNLNQTNLKELVRSFSNPRPKKDIFDLTGDIILKEEEQRRRPGYRLGYDSDPEYSTNKKYPACERRNQTFSCLFCFPRA